MLVGRRRDRKRHWTPEKKVSGASDTPAVTVEALSGWRAVGGGWIVRSTSWSRPGERERSQLADLKTHAKRFKQTLNIHFQSMGGVGNRFAMARGVSRTTGRPDAMVEASDRDCVEGR